MPTYCPVEYYGSGDGEYYYRCRVCDDCSYEDASSTRDDHGLDGCPECSDPGPCDPIPTRDQMKMLELTRQTHRCGIGMSGPLQNYAPKNRKFKPCCDDTKVKVYYAHYQDDNMMPRKAILFSGRAHHGENKHTNFALGQELGPGEDISHEQGYHGPDRVKFLSKGYHNGYCHLIEVAIAPNKKLKFHVHLKNA